MNRTNLQAPRPRPSRYTRNLLRAIYSDNRASRFSGWSFKAKLVSAALGVTVAGGTAFAATNWIVNLNSGSSGEGASAGISNLTITAASTPASTSLLYPGSSGNVVLTIANPNQFPVTITAVQLPANTVGADGYTTNALSVLQTGCLTASSDVTWTDATAISGSTHTLTTPLTVAASGAASNPLTVTLTGAATMSLLAPLACASTYFSMPSLIGVTATGGAATATTSPVTDGWTS